ncbi:MAG: hypothetical protein AB8B74_02915 [Crocinitomicaceae bacterium]
MKNILINSLNGFAVSDIPMFVFQLLVALLLIRLVQIVWSKKRNLALNNTVLIIGLAFTFMAILAKYSLPFAVLSLGVLLWMGKKDNQSDSERLLNLMVGLIGVGVGSFNIVLTMIVTFLMLLIIWFVSNKNNA